MLNEVDLIDDTLAGRLKAMVGFRNILVHEYRRLDLDIMMGVIEGRLDDLLEFARLAVAAGGD